MNQSTVKTHWYLNRYILDWKRLPILKQLLVMYTNIQPFYFDVRVSVSMTSFHNSLAIQSNAVRVHIVLVSAFYDFKRGKFGNMTPYKVIFWKGYRQADHYLKKVRLTYWMSLWSSNTCICIFFISSWKIMLAQRIIHVTPFLYFK